VARSTTSRCSVAAYIIAPPTTWPTPIATTPPPTANSSRSGSPASLNDHAWWPVLRSVATSVFPAVASRSPPTLTGPPLAKNCPAIAVLASAVSAAPGNTVITGGPVVGGSVPNTLFVITSPEVSAGVGLGSAVVPEGVLG
jgi:hypothetical protein